MKLVIQKWLRVINNLLIRPIVDIAVGEPQIQSPSSKNLNELPESRLHDYGNANHNEETSPSVEFDIMRPDILFLQNYYGKNIIERSFYHFAAISR